MLAEYVYLGDQLLAMIKPGESAYYFHNDHLGTPQVLTNDSGGIAWKAVYTPFGEAVVSIQTVENPFRFPGQYYDAEAGLHYNYFRYYNPPIGRYLTPDPIGLEGGINLFSYVANDPVNKTDIYGLLNPKGQWPLYSKGDYEQGVQALSEAIRAKDPSVSKEKATEMANDIMKEMTISEARKIKGLYDKNDLEGIEKLLKEIYDRAQRKKKAGPCPK
jgi:RHS repeat-associated protein